jgi:membrane protein YqaA with SNARE-associated domain
MKIFSALYTQTMVWARHPRASWYLAGLSFAESSFFPIPPDVMLAPMSLANPKRAWWLAGLTTIASVVGGLFGYSVGYWLGFDFIEPMLRDAGYWPVYLRAQEWSSAWGFWAIFLAAFSPIPYKMFTISAGVINMAFIPFILASFIGRGLRFFLVAALMAFGGATMEAVLHRYVDRIGWVTVLIVLVAILLYNI